MEDGDSFRELAELPEANRLKLNLHGAYKLLEFLLIVAVVVRNVGECCKHARRSINNPTDHLECPIGAREHEIA